MTKYFALTAGLLLFVGVRADHVGPPVCMETCTYRIVDDPHPCSISDQGTCLETCSDQDMSLICNDLGVGNCGDPDDAANWDNVCGSYYNIQNDDPGNDDGARDGGPPPCAQDCNIQNDDPCSATNLQTCLSDCSDDFVTMACGDFAESCAASNWADFCANRGANLDQGGGGTKAPYKGNLVAGAVFTALLGAETLASYWIYSNFIAPDTNTTKAA